MHNVCARLHSDAKWSDPLKYLWACFLTEWLWLSCAVYHWRCCTAEGVCTHLSCCKAPLSGTWFGLVSWARKHTALSLRLPPLDFVSGWHWAGGGKKKKSITPTPCPHKNESKLENNMQGPPNTRTLAICWCFLLHTVFAKLPLTACISNETLCPCGEGSKSVPVRTGTISPVWLL